MNKQHKKLSEETLNKLQKIKDFALLAVVTLGTALLPSGIFCVAWNYFLYVPFVSNVLPFVVSACFFALLFVWTIRLGVKAITSRMTIIKFSQQAGLYK